MSEVNWIKNKKGYRATEGYNQPLPPAEHPSSQKTIKQWFKGKNPNP